MTKHFGQVFCFKWTQRTPLRTDLLWKLYLLFLGWLMGLQGTEEEYVDWPVAGGSLTPQTQITH